ncbi:MAG: bacteriophage CI repressor [Bacteroidales bacterium]|nr:bacteriophage CI repressor [Bacteroidales bacterium]
MDKTLMLEQLINHYTDGNKANFAAMIGIKPQLLSNWLKRNTFDAELLYMKCKDISADWLLSGNGDMIRNTQNDNSQFVSQNNDPELIALCKALVENYQQRDDVMNKLVSIIKGI